MRYKKHNIYYDGFGYIVTYPDSQRVMHSGIKSLGAAKSAVTRHQKMIDRCVHNLTGKRLPTPSI